MKLVTGALWLQETACCGVEVPPGPDDDIRASRADVVNYAVVDIRLVDTKLMLTQQTNDRHTRGQVRDDC